MYQRTLRGLSLGLMAIVLSACSVVIPRVFPLEDLPPPSGPYEVGSQVLYWEDVGRDEWFTARPDDKRRLVVQVWYPTDAPSGQPMPYLLNADQRIESLANQLNMWPPLINHMREVQSNSYANAPLMARSDADRFNLLVFSHGLGGTRNQNAVQAEHLASHGYVVMSSDHPYDSYLTIFADGTTADFRSGADGELSPEEFWAFRTPQLQTRTADLRFMLDYVARLQKGGDRFWQQVDASHVGVFGHSYGGATSIMVGAEDERVKAVIALDGWMVPIPEKTIDAGLRQPFLYMGQTQWTDAANYAKLDRLLAANKSVSQKQILHGTKHADFSDTPQFSANAARFGLIGDIPRDELREILNREIQGFFDQHVAGSR